MVHKANHEILEAKTEEEFKALYPVYNELTANIKTVEEFLKLARILLEEGMHFLYIQDTIEGESKPRPVSLVTFRIQHCLYYRKQAHIHDLVTVSGAKKKGYAGALLDKTVEMAKGEKCNVVTLDSTYLRTDAQRLYMNKRFYTKAHHFCLDIDTRAN